MAAGVAHEINNPLTVIAGMVRLLPKVVDNPQKMQERVVMIERATERIAKIVGSLRKYSRSSDRRPYEKKRLAAIVSEVLILVDAKAKRHFTKVEASVDPNTVIMCDEIEMEQVLINLINNAVDAVKKLEERWVRVEAKAEGSFVVLQVRDSGKGIPSAVLEKLFQPFFTTKELGEGTGLGLSIARGILVEHGATIEVRSDAPNTCFEVRLPLTAEKANAV